MPLKGRYKIPIHLIGALKPDVVRHKDGGEYERKGSRTYLEHIAKALHGLEITNVKTQTSIMDDRTYLVIEYREKA